MFFFLFWLPLTALWTQNTFQKIINNQEGNFFAQLKASPDGESIYSITYDATSTQLSKIDKKGNLLWAKKIKDKSIFFTDSQLPLNNGVLIPTNIYTNGLYQAAQMIRFDENGNLLWCKKSSKDSLYFHSPVEDNEGNFWFMADRISFGSSVSTYTNLMKIDKNGNYLKGKRILFGNKNVEARHLLFDKKTESMICTLVDHSPGQLEEGRYVFAFDKNIQVKWSRKFQNNFGFSAFEKTDNFIFFIGFIIKKDAFSSIVLGKMDINDGKIIKSRVISHNEFPYLSCNSSALAIGFYNNNRLSKYNENLDPIWTSEFTNCTERTAIFPSLTESGECYFSRDIQDYKNFIIAKTKAQGTLENCTSKSINYSPFRDTIPPLSQNFTAFSLGNSKITLFDAILDVENTNLEIKNYCPKPDADFDLPSNICENTKFVPSNIKTLLGSHIWKSETYNKDSVPNLYFTQSGLRKVFHSITEDGCTDTTSRLINVLNTPKTPTDTIACNKKSITLNLNKTDADTFLLDKQLSPLPINISKSGIYNLILKNKSCQTEKNIKITFVETPNINFVIDSTFCKEEPYLAKIEGFKNVLWDKKSGSDSILIRDDIVHFYEATYEGCELKGALQIPRKTCPFPEILFIPNIFSPNDDGFNDVFEGYGQGFILKKMLIFDRWGNQIFYSEQNDATWNGTFRNEPLPASVFTYIIDYQDIKRDIIRQKKGDVMLIR